MENKKGLSPLEGIKVADFSISWAGPVSAMMLADMGAEVIKIENPERPDVARSSPPFAEHEPGTNRSGWFAIHNRGKKDCLLDLKNPENIDIAKNLVRVSDIVIENFAPRVMDSLGLGYSSLKEVKEDIIMVSLSGYGASGPDRDCVAFGENIEALSGLSSLIGDPVSQPQGCGMVISDQISGMLGAYAALVALHYRDQTGKGQHIDLSELQALIATIPEPFMEFTMTKHIPAKLGNRDYFMAPHNCYRCKGEDRWIAIAIETDEEWRELCLAMDKPQLLTHSRLGDRLGRIKNQDMIDTLINEWTLNQNATDIMIRLQEHGIACGPVHSGEQLYNDPHLLSRGFFVELLHPEVGKRIHPGVFAKLSETPGSVRSPDPLLGQHTEWLLNMLNEQQER